MRREVIQPWMNSDDWLATRILQRDDDLRHCCELVPASNTENALLVTSAWRREAQSVMGMPIAEIAQRPIVRESLAELPQVFNIQPKMSIVALRVWASFCRKKNDRDFVPSAKQIPDCFYRPSGFFCCNCSKLRFPAQ